MLPKRRQIHYTKIRLCRQCGVQLTPTSPRQLYCGNAKAKTGCAYAHGKQMKQTANRSTHAQKYRRKHLKRSSALAREYARKLRQRVLLKYGSRCARCGFTDIRALQLDHINGYGNQHRKQMRQRRIYQMSLENNDKMFQLLCANCNSIKKYAEDPHNRVGRPRQTKPNQLNIGRATEFEMGIVKGEQSGIRGRA